MRAILHSLYSKKLNLGPFRVLKIKFIAMIQGPNCVFKHNYLVVLLMNRLEPYKGQTVTPICIKMQIPDIGQPPKKEGLKIALKIKKCNFFIFSP